MKRRTKIVATLGPSTDDPEVLEQLILTGVDVVRLNFSHSTVADHERRAKAVSNLAKKHHRVVGILADLQGPKIRIARFKEEKIFLHEDEEFILDAKLGDAEGDINAVGIDYKELPKDVSKGDSLLLDDGRIVLAVEKVKGKQIICQVKTGGVLSNNKGINRLGGGLSAGALTAKDRKDLVAATKMGVEYIAVSFPRSAADIHDARKLIEKEKSKAGIIAKIERAEAVEAIDEIIEASDGVMVARGDLAVEIGDAEVPVAQKLIIDRARALNKPVITATQMMESMIDHPIPTRAEVSDVANAVLDTTDAVMLSAETAAGKYPIKAVAAMIRVCMVAEKLPDTQTSGHRIECQFNRVDEAIAMSAMYAANHMNIKAVVAMTESGTTPLWMSRIRTGIPILSLSRNPCTCGKMALFRGVYPIFFDVTEVDRYEIKQAAIKKLQELELVQKGDFIIMTKGEDIGIRGRSNTMKILEV